MAGDLPSVGAKAEIQNLPGFRRAVAEVNRGLEGMGSHAGGLASKITGPLGSALSWLGNVGLVVVSTAAVSAAAALAGVTAAAVSFISRGIEMNASLEQLTIQLETTTGQGEEMMAWVREMSKVTPFTTETLASTLSMAAAYGFTAEEAQGLAIISGDVAAAMGGGAETMQRIIRALGQMKARTKVTANEMLQLTEAGIPAWEILADAIGVAVPELQEMVSEGVVPADEAIEALGEALGEDFGGAMEKQSKTMKGMKETLQETISLMAADITAPLFDVLKDALADLLTYLQSPEFQEIADVLGGQLAQVASVVAEQLGPALEWVFTNLLPGAVEFIQGIPGFFDDIANSVGDFAASFEDVPIVGDLLFALSSLLSGNLSDALHGVTQAAEPFQDFLSRMGEWWKEHGPGIQETAGKLFEKLQTALVELASDIGPWIAETLGQLAYWFEENGPNIEIAIQRIGEVLGRMIEIVGAAWKFVGPILTGIIDIVLLVVGTIAAVIAGDWDRAWRNLVAIPLVALNAIYEAMFGFLGRVLEIFGSSWEKLRSDWAGVFANLKTIVETVLGNIVSNVSEFISHTINFYVTGFQNWLSTWRTYLNLIKTVVFDIFTSILSRITSIMDSIKSAIQGKIEAAKAAFTNALNGMKGAIQPVVSNIQNLIAAAQSLWRWLKDHVFNFRINLPKLPEWATPGSPMPIELAMRSFADELRSVQRLTPPALASMASLAPAMVPVITPAPTVTVQGGSTYNTQNWTFEAHYPQSQNPRRLIVDIEYMMLMSRGY